MREFWNDVMNTAKSKAGIHKTARSWEMKYGRLRKAYEAYVRRVNVSGREGDEEDLYERPLYYSEIHELESKAARNTLLGAISSEMPAKHNIYGRTVSSTRKKTQSDKLEFLRVLEEKHHSNHSEIIKEVRGGNKHRAELVGLVGELVQAVKKGFENDKNSSK